MMRALQRSAFLLALALCELCSSGCETTPGTHGPHSSHGLATLNVATTSARVAVTVRRPERDPETSSRLDTLVLDDEGRVVATIRGARGPAWFGGGRLLATITGLPGEQSVTIWDADGGDNREFACPAVVGHVTPVAGAPDGTALALGILQPPATSRGYKVVICDAADGSQLGTIDNVLSGPAWSSDGKRIAYVAEQADATAALKVRPAGSESPTILAEASSIRVGRWGSPPDRLVYSTLDPSGAWTAFYSTDWSPSSAGGTWLLSYFGSGRACVSTGFKYLAYDTDSGVRVMDLTTGTPSAPAEGYCAGWAAQLLIVTRQTADMDRGGTTYIAALEPSSLKVVWTYPR